MANTASNSLGNNGGRLYSFLTKPVWIDCTYTVTSTNGLGVTNVKGAGIQNIFMHTSITPTKGANGYLNPNPAVGYAVIQLQSNYNRYSGGFAAISSATTGSSLAINSTALTVGAPYVINAVGHGPLGSATIAPVADSSGSLASKWFTLYDSYGNTFIIWFSVSGVGSAPIGVSGTLVQQTISTNATAATIGAALVTTINGLLAAQPGNLAAPAGVFSFTASGTTTVTVTSTQTNPYGPLPGTPADGVLPTGFAFAVVNFSTNQQDWNGVGLPKGIVPNIGASFIATATGYSTGGGSTGTVMVPGASSVSDISVVGDPNQTLGPIPLGGSPNVGGFIMVQFLGPTSATNTAQIATAPADGSLISLGFYVEAASVYVLGE